ncbi:MAG: SspB family protein [Alphaproteobacteria bacterium]
MDYQALVERAMKNVVRDVLLRVAEDGLPGEHHLYITFRTEHDGVEIADRLVAQYPDEMTIVLQYQFWGLEIYDDAFEITLSFSGKNERLFIPFDAVVGFADPSVNFGLQFKAAVGADVDTDPDDPQDIEPPEDFPDRMSEGEQDDSPASDEQDDGDQKTGEVVALDAFRKKKT